MKYLLVFNPGSHSGKSRKRLVRLRKLLTEAGIDYELRETRSLGDAVIYSREANEMGYDAVVAVGGDGTINGVINGFYNNAGRRISKAKFGVIYTGTSPDFCNSYNIPLQIEEAVARFVDPVVIRIPVGEIVLKDSADPLTSSDVVKYFGCCANIGLGAALARKANGGIRKLVGDFPGTLVSLIILLFRYRANTFTRVMDGKEEKVDHMYNTSVGITPFIASGIKMVMAGGGPEGHLYHMTVKKISFANVVPMLRKVYAGKPFSNTGYLSVGWCREAEFRDNKQNPEVEFDGDPAGYLPCRIKLAEEPLDLIV